MRNDGRPASLVQDLRSAEAERRLAALRALAARTVPAGEDELEALLECLCDERKLVLRRAAEAAAALARRGASLAPKLRRRLDSAAWNDRWGAVYALSLLDELGPEGIATLADSLGSQDRDLRWAGLDLMKRLAVRHRDRVVECALALACRGTPVQRRLAFYLLRDLGAGGDEVIAAAVDGLATADASLRLAALAALAAAGGDSEDAARRVAALVSDPDPHIGRAAAAALGSLRRPPSPEVRAALQHAARSDDSALRRAAEFSLRRLAERR